MYFWFFTLSLYSCYRKRGWCDWHAKWLTKNCCFCLTLMILQDKHTCIKQCCKHSHSSDNSSVFAQYLQALNFCRLVQEFSLVYSIVWLLKCVCVWGRDNVRHGFMCSHSQPFPLAQALQDAFPDKSLHFLFMIDDSIPSERLLHDWLLWCTRHSIPISVRLLCLPWNLFWTLHLESERGGFPTKIIKSTFFKRNFRPIQNHSLLWLFV